MVKLTLILLILSIVTQIYPEEATSDENDIDLGDNSKSLAAESVTTLDESASVGCRILKK